MFSCFKHKVWLEYFVQLNTVKSRGGLKENTIEVDEGFALLKGETYDSTLIFTYSEPANSSVWSMKKDIERQVRSS